MRGNVALSVSIPIAHRSYDNSGHRIPYPLWQTDSKNVERTNAIMRTIAAMFAHFPQVVSMVSPVNE